MQQYQQTVIGWMYTSIVDTIVSQYYEKNLLKIAKKEGGRNFKNLRKSKWKLAEIATDCVGCDGTKWTALVQDRIEK
jgi:hypothetical protein